MKTKGFEIKTGNGWSPVTGTTQGLKPGWLHWEDRDHCVGLARPGTWREAPAPNQVFLDPALKDGSFCVFFEGKIVASGYNSKGAAEAALGLYVSGYRKVRAHA